MLTSPQSDQYLQPDVFLFNGLEGDEAIYLELGRLEHALKLSAVYVPNHQLRSSFCDMLALCRGQAWLPLLDGHPEVDLKIFFLVSKVFLWQIQT